MQGMGCSYVPEIQIGLEKRQKNFWEEGNDRDPEPIYILLEGCGEEKARGTVHLSDEMSVEAVTS